MIEFMPEAAGVASRRWDDQHLEIGSARGQVRDADGSGFTPAVAGAARRFGTAWERHLAGLAGAAEEQADGLRDAISAYLGVDQDTAAVFDPLTGYLVELR